MPKLPFALDGSKFAHTWIGLRATRWMRNMFNSLGGEENFRFLIQKNRNLLDLFPPEVKAQFKKDLQVDPALIKSFSNTEVYGWIPPEYKRIVESEPNGPAWVAVQLTQIRTALLSP